jgi:hypothetical protein
MLRARRRSRCPGRFLARLQSGTCLPRAGRRAEKDGAIQSKQDDILLVLDQPLPAFSISATWT